MVEISNISIFLIVLNTEYVIEKTNILSIILTPKIVSIILTPLLLKTHYSILCKERRVFYGYKYVDLDL